MKKFMSRGWFTCVFVCLSCFLISEKLSAEVNGGDEVRTVTLNMWNVSLKEILTEIEKQAGVTFSYESSLLKEFQKTSFKVNDAALDDCLARLFAGYPFVYKRTGNIVVLKRKPRQVTISGFVRDKTSAESLVGASVYEVNSLPIPMDSLVFRCLYRRAVMVLPFVCKRLISVMRAICSQFRC